MSHFFDPHSSKVRIQLKNKVFYRCVPGYLFFGAFRETGKSLLVALALENSHFALQGNGYALRAVLLYAQSPCALVFLSVFSLENPPKNPVFFAKEIDSSDNLHPKKTLSFGRFRCVFFGAGSLVVPNPCEMRTVALGRTGARVQALSTKW